MPVDVARCQASLMLLTRLGHPFDPASASHLQTGVTSGTRSESDELLTLYFRNLKDQEAQRRSREGLPALTPNELNQWLEDQQVTTSAAMIQWRLHRVIAENDSYW